jgi:branched-chain amino acid transport system substrate-binding protein
VRRRRVQVALLCSALLAAAACGGAETGMPPPSIRVVLVDAFTGPAAVRGEVLQNSLQLEIDALNAHGGLLGRRVELVATDDEMKAPKAADLVREHLADERVGLLVGPSGTPAYAAARPWVDQSRMPECLPVRVGDDAVAGAPTSFRTRAADRTSATVLLEYLRAHTRVRSLAAISAGDVDGRTMDGLLGDLSPRSGVAYAGTVSLAAAGDAHAAVQQAVAAGAQGVVLPGDVAAAASVSRALQDMGLRDQVPAFGLDGLATLAFPDQAREAVIGTVVVSPIRADLTDAPIRLWPPAYRAFEQGVAARYGYTINGVEIKGLPEAAECVALWTRAVRRAGTFDGQRVAHTWELLQIDAGQSILGAPERFTPRQHDALASDGLFVYQWTTQRGDQFRLKQVLQ